MNLCARLLSVMLAAVAMPAAGAFAQIATNAPPVVAGAKPVTVEHIKVHAPSIEGNLGGESADRDVIVVLQPGNAAEAKQR